MRTIKYLLILIFSVYFSSCEEREIGQPSYSQQEQIEDHTGGNQNETSTKSVSDSINSLKTEIDKISLDITANQATLDKLESKIKQLESSKSEKYFWLLAGICLVALTLSFIAIAMSERSKSLRQRIDKRKDENQSLEREVNYLSQQLQNIVRQLQNNTSYRGSNNSLANNEFVDIRRRLNNIEAYLNGLKMQPRQPGQPSQPNDQPDRHQSSTDYFGEVTETAKGAFRKLLGSNTDDAMFRAVITGDIATFEPISWDKIKSNDNALYVVECSGLTPREATNMNIIAKGEAKRVGSNKWEVTKKIEIKLS